MNGRVVILSTESHFASQLDNYIVPQSCRLESCDLDSTCNFYVTRLESTTLRNNTVIQSKYSYPFAIQYSYHLVFKVVLPHLIRKVSMDFLLIQAVRHERQSHVARMIEDHVGRGSCDQHVCADISLVSI
jgi:hypothetical protein